MYSKGVTTGLIVVTLEDEVKVRLHGVTTGSGSTGGMPLASAIMSVPALDSPLIDTAARCRSRINTQHVYSGSKPKSNTISGSHTPRRDQGRATSSTGIVDPTSVTEDSRENMESRVCSNVGAIARGIGRELQK